MNNADQPTTPGELSAIHDRLNAGELRMKRIEEQVFENTELTRENTALTQDIKDLLDAARMGFKVLGGVGVAVKWIGMIAAAGVAIWSAFYAITHGGATPK